jgi:predicted metal-dependent phosphoesterase TrpH
MSIGDFHTHSTRSDGVLSPTDLVELAASGGVRVMALTDHDTLAGLDEALAAAADRPGFTVIPGVELSCDAGGTKVHLLGHFVDRTNREFVGQLERLRTGRSERAKKMVEALAGLGAPIDWERVQELARKGSVGRPHIARALIEQGHAKTISDAFDRYVGDGGPAYVERKRLAAREAIEMIRNANGLPVFAHPPRYTEDYGELAASLASDGLFGMEVFYRDYSVDRVQSLHAVADSLELFALGGSDYHGLGNPGERKPGDIPLPDAVAEAYLAAAREAGCDVPEPTTGS